MSVRQITEDDCHSECFPPLDSVATATVALMSSRCDCTIVAAVAGQESGALADALAHSGGAVAVPDFATEAVADWASRIGARQVVTAYLPTAWRRRSLCRASASWSSAALRQAHWPKREAESSG